MNRCWLTIVAALIAFGVTPHARAQSGEVRLVVTAASIDEDATLLDPGTVSIDLDSNFNRTQGGYYLSAPGVGVALGITSRLELLSSGGLAVSKDQENRTYGLDDNYFGAKILLFPKTERRPAIAIMPTLEVLNTSGIAPGLIPHRVNFALPVLVEKDFDDWSVSYTGGYITRGLAFSTVKLEGDWWEKLTPVLTVSYSQFTSNLGMLSELGVSRGQTNAAIGIERVITPRWSVFADVGRSIGRTDSATASFECTFGVTFSASLWTRDSGKDSRRTPIHF
jgi:hypothetical protein